MKFICFGVGAIGTYIGGSLAVSGQRVVFVERPEVAADVRQRGLSLKIGEVNQRVEHPHVVNSLAEAMEHGPYDAAILAVKSFDTPSVLAEASRLTDKMPAIVCLQNGVENETLIEQVLGPQRVVSATVTTSVGRRGAGSIAVEKLRGVGVAVDHPLGADLVAAFNLAGLRAKAYPNGPGMKWSKMVTNLLANASSAILDMPPYAIFAHAGMFRLETAMLKEVLAVMEAQSIHVTDLPSTPVLALTWIVKWLPAVISQPLLLQSLGKGRGEKMPSFHIDLYAGRGQSEVDYLNGAVVRFGEKLHIPVPVNRWLNQTLIAITAGTVSKAEYAHQPEKMIRAVAAAGSQPT